MCTGPELVETPAAVGSPVPATAPTAVSPVASPAASPAAVPEITPIDDESAAAITATIERFAACLTEGNPEGVVELVTARYLGAAYGGGRPLSPEDYLVLTATAPVIPVRILSVSDISLDLPTTASATVESIAGNQLRLERWTLIFRADEEAPAPEGPLSDGTDAGAGFVIEEGGEPVQVATPVPGARGHWLLQGVSPLAANAPSGASSVDVTISEYEIELASVSVAGPDVVIRGENTGSEAHELLVLRLDGGATTGDLLRPPGDAFPSGISVVGQVLIAPGATGEVALVGLESGSYSIVCLLPDPSGVPHLALGEETTLTIQ